MITARPPRRPGLGETATGDRRSGTARHDGPRSTLGLGVGVGVAVVAVTAAVDPGGLAPFGPARWAVAGAAAAAVAAVALGRRRFPVARLPTAALLAFVGWAAVAAAFGEDPLYAWTGTPERHAGVLAWVLCALAFLAGQAVRPAERRAVAPFVTAAAVVAGGWALAEVLGWTPFALTGVTGRPGGPFGSSAYLGAAAALLAPPAWGLAFDASRRRAARLAAAAGAALATIALVASGARAAWAGVAVAVALLGLVRRRPSVRRRAALLAAGAVAVVAVALATGVAGRLPDLVHDERGGARGRLAEWRVSARVIAARPVAGTGPEGYRIAFADHVDEAYETAHGRDPLPDRAHAAVLDVAATTGLPGAALYVLALAAVARLALRALRHGEAWTAAVACGVTAYFAQSLVFFPIPELDVVAWLLAGLVAGAVVVPGESAAWRPRRAAGAAAGVLAVGLAVAGVLDVAADRGAARALDSVARGAPVDVDRAARLRPDAVRYHLVAARGHEARGTVAGLDAALERIGDAARVSPRDPVVSRERARLLLARARHTATEAHVHEARAALEALARRDPHNAEVHLRLGLARALAGDDSGAEAAWLLAERLAPRSAAASVNLAVAYARAGRLDAARQAAVRALARHPGEERARQVLRAVEGGDGT